MAGRIFFGDAVDVFWESVFDPWLSQQGGISELPSIILTPSVIESNFLKRKMIQEKRGSLGVYFWNLFQIRQFLVKKFDLSLGDGSIFQWLMRAAAEGCGDGVNLSTLQQDTKHYFYEIERLIHSGMQWGKYFPDEWIKEYEEIKSVSGWITPAEVDQKLLGETPQQIFQSVVIVGFDAGHFQSLNLLRAVNRLSKDVILCTHLPRLRTEYLDTLWVNTWEQELGTNGVTLEDKNNGRFEKLVEACGLMDELKAPSENFDFQLIDNLSDQVEAILFQIVQWLEREQVEQIVIAVPAQTALGREISIKLDQLKLSYHDGIGHRVSKDLDLWREWFHWQLDGKYISFWKWFEKQFKVLNKPEVALEDVRMWFEDVRVKILSDRMDLILDYLKISKKHKLTEIIKFIESCTVSDEEFKLGDFLNQVEKIFINLNWSSQIRFITELKERYFDLLDESSSRQSCLKWLDDVMSYGLREKSECGNHSYAKIVLLDIWQAQMICPSHLIIAGLGQTIDSQNHVDFSNNHDDIKNWNQKIQIQGKQGSGHVVLSEGKSVYLLPEHKRVYQSEIILSLIRNTSDHVVCIEALNDQKKISSTVSLPDILQQLHMIQTGEWWSESEGLLFESKKTRWNVDSRNFDVTQTVEAFNARRDAFKPFGTHDFSLDHAPERQIAMSCRDLEEMLVAPGIVWMKYFLGVEKETLDSLIDLKGKAKGIRIHNWLHRSWNIHAQQEWFLKPENVYKHFDQIVRLERNELEEFFREHDFQLPLILNSTWYECLAKTETLIRALENVSDYKWMQTEKKLRNPTTIHLNDKLRLNITGRMDVILSREAQTQSEYGEDILIVDYKTGAKPDVSLKSMAKGNGTQLALYGLAVMALGAKNVQLSFLSDDDFNFCLDRFESLQGLWEGMAFMQRTGIFGNWGELDSEYGRSVRYPLATLHIDSQVIEKRKLLTHTFLKS
jgi:hypothetical protein